MLGRTTAGTGAVEELSVGTGLSLSAGTLAVGTVAVPNGGTGLNTLTANNVLLGNGTSAVQTVAPGASGNVLTSNGTTWASSASPRDAWVQISSAAFVAGGTTFSSIPTTYSDLLVVVYDVESSGTANISYALGTSTTFSSAISLNNYSNFGSVGIYIPAYKNDRGIAITNFTQNATVPTSPTLSDGSPDTTFWVVTGGVVQIRLTGSSVVGGTGTAVLYGK
jgi:hypothetical protein